jgi:hypothetical protein
LLEPCDNRSLSSGFCQRLVENGLKIQIGRDPPGGAGQRGLCFAPKPDQADILDMSGVIAWTRNPAPSCWIGKALRGMTLNPRPLRNSGCDVAVFRGSSELPVSIQCDEIVELAYEHQERPPQTPRRATDMGHEPREPHEQRLRQRAVPEGCPAPKARLERPVA